MTKYYSWENGIGIYFKIDCYGVVYVFSRPRVLWTSILPPKLIVTNII